MERENKKLTIIVGALLLVIGVSFSYFLATSLIKGNGASTVGTTARINGATLNIEGTLNIDDESMLPGHKNVSAIKVTATGNNQLIAYNLIWKGTNEISQINYTVYKSSTPKTISTNCSNKTSVANGMQVLSEECSVNNIDTLGEAIAEGSINKGDTKVILAKDEFITATSSGTSWYYYVVLEYPNLDIDQSSDVEATFEGEVTVEESDKKADIDILAVYVADDSGNYTETTDIPQSGYGLNSNKSTCSNGATPIWDYENNGIIAANLTKSGTSCYLYFDKAKKLNNVVESLNANTAIPDFSQAATVDEGIYAIEDGMYGGTSYYWRGAATTNYLRFAGYCWRIVRINGDGSIRLIYDGETCHANGFNTSDSLVGIGGIYNYNYNKSEYVGWTYTEGLQRPTNVSEGVASNMKIQAEAWYNSSIGINSVYNDKVLEGKFCNDRTINGGDTWASQPSSSLIYDGFKRITSPTLSCTNVFDVYELKVGLITSDEIIMAGGKWNENNIQYYLYNGQNYWTMSPHRFNVNGSIVWAHMFVMKNYGNLGYAGVNDGDFNNPQSANIYSLRPVINLRSDIMISSGDGTLNNPYIVED